MANPMRSTDFKQVVEPILNTVFDGVYDQRAPEYTLLFEEKDGIKRAYQEDVVLRGMPLAQEIPDGRAVPYESGGVHYVTRYPYKVYGMAFAITRILVEDGDHIRVASTFSEHMAQSLIETRETKAANVLNNAFSASYLGGDQVALCATTHPIFGAANASNRLSSDAALSQTSLEQMLIQIRQAVDDAGKKIRVAGKKLVVHPANMFQAQVLLKSTLRAGTANNDINPILTSAALEKEPVVLSRLTSSTAWFIKTDAPMGLRLLWRRRLDKAMEGDFETDSMRYKATERFGLGWTNWRTAFGTPGL